MGLILFCVGWMFNYSKQEEEEKEMGIYLSIKIKFETFFSLVVLVVGRGKRKEEIKGNKILV